MNDDTPLITGVLGAMGLLVARRVDGGFRWVGTPPPWAEAFGCSAQGPCDLAGSFAFMEMFLYDAEAFWAQAQGPATVSSAPWSEPDRDGVDHQLEAVAMRLPSSRGGAAAADDTDEAVEVLVVAGAGADFAQTQSILQAARERRLAVDRELGVQRQVEQQLRLRVQQRTVELARTNEQLRTLAAQVGLAEQRERHRLAVGLHDHVGQLLAAAKMLAGAEHAAAADDDARRERLAGLLDVMGQAIDATRTLTFELSPPMLYELGLVPTLASLVEQVGRRHPSLDCVFRDDGEPKAVAQDVEVMLFQIARELINNALKHAGATQLVVETRAEPQAMTLVVTDDGAGFDPRALDEPVVGVGGFGLHSVRERLGHLGGQLDVQSRPGSGSTFRVRVPLA